VPAPLRRFGVSYGCVADKSQYGYPPSATPMIITALKGKNGWKVFAQNADANGFRVERIDKPTG